MIRKLYSRERLVGREVFRATRREKNRHTGKVRYVKLPQEQWLVRESPHLRILTDELAAAVRAKLNLAAQSFGKTAKDRTKKVHRTDLRPVVCPRLASVSDPAHPLTARVAVNRFWQQVFGTGLVKTSWRVSSSATRPWR